jgi:hypothetical protein
MRKIVICTTDSQAAGDDVMEKEPPIPCVRPELQVFIEENFRCS